MAIGGVEGLGATVTLGIIAGLVLGKPVGIVGTTWLLTRFTRSSLDMSLRRIDVTGVAILAGIGFPVSLLVAELSFGVGTEHGDHAKAGIFVASLLAALLAAVVLVARNRHYRHVEALARVDADADGIPDVFEQHG